MIKARLKALKEFNLLFLERLLKDKVDFGMFAFILILGIVGWVTDTNFSWTMVGFAGYVASLIWRFQYMKDKLKDGSNNR